MFLIYLGSIFAILRSKSYVHGRIHSVLLQSLVHSLAFL